MRDDTQRLVQEASAGDLHAIEDLLQQFLPDLRAFVRLRAGGKILAKETDDDLVQSVCREVLQGAGAFEYEGVGRFKNWLFKTALHKILAKARYYGARRRDPAREVRLATDPQYFSGYGSLLSPSRVAVQKEDVDRVERAFEALPPDYIEVITLSRIVGLSHAEIGEEMGRTAEASRALLHRALARLGMELSR